MQSRKENRNRRSPLTYGVNGLMEWMVYLPTGSTHKPYIPVCFEGGQISGYGIAPAKFTTSDPYIQQLIEQSEWYRRGKIFIIR